MAAYFDIAVWVRRLIFVLPLVVGIFTSIFRHVFWFDYNPFPGIVFGSFGGTLFITYAILWAVIPEAKSASDKLEMRGEKVDLNTIKNTIQEDLEGFKSRAEKWGGEVKERAQNSDRNSDKPSARRGNSSAVKQQRSAEEAVAGWAMP